MRAYLVAASISPVIRLTFPQANVIPCLAAVFDHPVVKPSRPGSQADCRAGRPNRMMKRRHSCFNDPGRAAFPSDADLHRR